MEERGIPLPDRMVTTDRDGTKVARTADRFEVLDESTQDKPLFIVEEDESDQEVMAVDLGELQTVVVTGEKDQ